MKRGNKGRLPNIGFPAQKISPFSGVSEDQSSGGGLEGQVSGARFQVPGKNRDKVLG